MIEETEIKEKIEKMYKLLNVTSVALVSLLIDKKIITVEEFEKYAQKTVDIVK